MPAFAGLTVDGEPARLVASDDPTRVRFLPGVGGLDVEFVARDVPGLRVPALRGRRRPTPAPDDVDDGREIAAGDRPRRASPTTARSRVTIGGRTLRRALRDRGLRRPRRFLRRRPRPAARASTSRTVGAARRHASGIATPASSRASSTTIGVARRRSDASRRACRSCAAGSRSTTARPIIGCGCASRPARPSTRSTAATTFDTARRDRPHPSTTRGGSIPRRRTFAHQGWIAANGLVVGAPGLPEAEVTPDGEILVTLVRSVGALARIELRTRPDAGRARDAGARRADARTASRATITLAARAGRRARGRDRPARRARRRRPAARRRRVAARTLDAATSVLSACKPADDGDGIVVRVLNPTDEPDDVDAAVRLRRRPTRARCDSTRRRPASRSSHDGRDGRADAVPPHALRSVRVHALRR